MKRLPTLIVSFLAFTFVFAANPAKASLLGDDSHIQLKHIMAQVKGKKGALTNPIRPLTPVLTVPNGEHVAFVCQRAPRASEAILYYFSKYPAPLDKKRRVDVEALKEQKGKIAGFVNKALGRAVVSEVYVVEGGKAMGRGVMSRLPFAQTHGCGRVLEEYEQRMQQLLGGEKKKAH